jgi:small nuclear ribonucleoprotein (snRNP)-like protein
MGTRNEEFPMMKDKLSSIIARLEAGEEPTGEPLAYHDLARELFPIAHLFESVGFMSVGKEIAHVERALIELEPEAEVSDRPYDPVQPPATSSSGAAEVEEAPAIDEAIGGEEVEDSAERKSVPKPVLASFFVLIVAIATATALILKTGPFAQTEDPPPMASTVTMVPTQTTVPSLPTRAPQDAVETPTTEERYAEALSQARLSLRNGNTDEALKYLSIASLIDRHDNSVVEVANSAVEQLLGEARTAATEGKWEEAASFIAEGRVVAARFDLDTFRINAAEQQIAEMERYRIVKPGETQVLRASIGERVEIRLEDGKMLVGQIVAVSDPNLVLDVEDDVGGGVVRFTDEIPLSTISWIRIWED